ncbi:hypothetical protein [Streptomyces griseochromogenes]|uniref:hypothetical protein n=1 Tax=Streptomyces griseochromogenes TaxID=68214 RepID=UPI0037B208A6
MLVVGALIMAGSPLLRTLMRLGVSGLVLMLVLVAFEAGLIMCGACSPSATLGHPRPPSATLGHPRHRRRVSGLTAADRVARTLAVRSVAGTAVTVAVTALRGPPARAPRSTGPRCRCS